MPLTSDAEMLPRRKELAAETLSGGPPRLLRWDWATRGVVVPEGGEVRVVVSRVKRRESVYTAGSS